MWILIRIGFAVAFALGRWAYPLLKFGTVVHALNGREYRLRKEKSKHGNVVSTTAIFDSQSPVSFRLVPESQILKFCKTIGPGREFQTGHAEFDDAFYIVSDSPGFLSTLKDHPDLIADFLSLGKSGWNKIGCDRHRLTIRASGDAPVDESVLSLIERVSKYLNIIGENSGRDPFLLRFLVLEIILWSGLGYMMGSITEILFDESTHTIEWMPLALAGLAAGVAALIIWFGAVYLALGKSSRAPMLVAESLVGLLIGVIFVGPQALIDLNQSLDTSKPEFIGSIVDGKHTQRSSGRNASTHYYLDLRENGPYGLGRHLRVSTLDYWRFTPPQQMTFVIYRGYFNARYIGALTPGSTQVAAASSNSSAESSVPLRKDLIDQAIVAASWNAEPVAALAEKVSEERWPTGGLKSRLAISNGQLNGVSEYFHPNGKVYSQIQWKNGKKHGRYKTYREDGSLEGSFNMRDGVPHGWLYWYDQNSKLTQEQVYDSGAFIPLTSAEKKEVRARARGGA